MNLDRFLKTLINYELRPGYDYDLVALERFLTGFGRPHLSIGKAIHIAGTKGKGSVAAITASCLRAAGYNVGLYTSPHLESVNERIRYNGRKISRRDLVDYIELIKPHIKKSKTARTFFEVLTTVAFMYFRDRKCDISVLEVGLGGRIDATNVCMPMITVIGRIGYDHTNLLGTSLAQIAREKAGIIKPGVPVIAMRQRPTVDRIIAAAARANTSVLVNPDRYFKINLRKISFAGTDVDIKGAWGHFKTRLPLIGRHQIENLMLSLQVLYECKNNGFRINRDALIKGIAGTRLSGRFQKIRRKPIVIYDCAHNPESFRALHNNIKDLAIKEFTLIFGASRHKDVSYCINNIFPMASDIFIVPLNNPRSYSISGLLVRASRFKNKITTAPSVTSALNKALRARKKDRRTIIITGSFFMWPHGNDALIK